MTSKRVTTGSRRATIDVASRDKSRDCRSGGDAGFTLIEVLVAFAVLVMILLPLSNGLSQSTIGGRRAQSIRALLLQAQSKLDELGTSDQVIVGETAGQFDNGAAWRLAVSSPAGGQAAKPRGAWAKVTVSAANDAGGPLSVSLTTYKLVGAASRK